MKSFVPDNERPTVMPANPRVAKCAVACARPLSHGLVLERGSWTRLALLSISLRDPLRRTHYTILYLYLYLMQCNAVPTDRVFAPTVLHRPLTRPMLSVKFNHYHKHYITINVNINNILHIFVVVQTNYT